MPKITAMIHASNDGARIGRTLDSLHTCDELLVIDHQSSDDTAKIAKEHGATVKPAVFGVDDGAYVVDVANDWVLCLLPSEALSEPLERSLAAWKDSDPASATGFAMSLREETDNGWKNGGLEMRLVNRKNVNWTGTLPPNSKAPTLEGDLLRFKH